MFIIGDTILAQLLWPYVSVFLSVDDENVTHE